jgi:hypothetical protein
VIPSKPLATKKIDNTHLRQAIDKTPLEMKDTAHRAKFPVKNLNKNSIFTPQKPGLSLYQILEGHY